LLTEGAQVAGYRIIRELGQGGMGAVYLAANPTLPRHDALKVLSRELSRDPDFRTRFLREADVAAGLDHPNIVSVYNRGQSEDGQLWIAMQFVDGTDADAAQRSGTMSPYRAVHVITEVAKALDHAHAHQVVHRDIKPANFLLSGPIGPSERVLLGDFGIARALGDIGLTVTGAVLATVAYAAPEVLAGEPFDGRSDIYSLGCTLFRLLTGRAPFPGTNGMAAVMLAHLQQPPPRVTDLVPTLPPAMDAVIAIAMAKDPAARFPTATALAEAAINALQNPHAVLRTPAAPSFPGPPPVRPQPPRRRRTALIGAIAAVALLVVGTVAVIAWPSGDDSATPNGSGPELTRQTTSSTEAGPPATDVAPTALRGILLPASAVGDDGSGTPLVLEQDSPDLLNDTATVNDPQCLGAWLPAQQPVYADTTISQAVPTGSAVQVLRALNKSQWQDSVIQAAVAFPAKGSTPAMPVGMARTVQQNGWEACAGHDIVVTPPGEAPQTWTFGPTRNTSGVATLEATLSGGGGSCQRGMLIRGNVLIDVRQCRSAGGNDVAKLVLAIADRVPNQ
jgi:eukaryotic-like serine/threonine-protein kinase